MNLVLVSLDCVRPESLGCYGNGRARTPHLDRIARDGVRFTQCIVQAPYTPPSHASMLTGLNPYRHGVQAMWGKKLRPDIVTLAEWLGARGYRTGAFVSSRAVGSLYGFGRGFDVYDEEPERRVGGLTRRIYDADTRREIETLWRFRRFAAEVTDRALGWLGAGARDPFFLFLHYIDAHDLGEDEPPSEEYQLFQTARIDRQIGRLLDSLDRRRLYEDTAIIVTADHGDSYGEHLEFNHREALFDPTLRVPLLLKADAVPAGRVVDAQVRSIDIAPTLLELAGHGAEGADLDGRALQPLLAGRELDERPAYSEACYQVSVEHLDVRRSHYIGLRTSRWKLVLDRLAPLTYLYDLHRDPGERCNVATACVDEARELERRLLAMLDDGAAAADREMSSEEMEQARAALEGLGYL